MCGTQNHVIKKKKDKYREVRIPKIYFCLGEKYPEIKKFVAIILFRFGSTN